MPEPWQPDDEEPKVPPILKQLLGADPEARAAADAQLREAVAEGELRYPLLPPFRRWRRCRQCGHRGGWIGARAAHFGPGEHRPIALARLGGLNSVLIRQCRRCHYCWAERPIGAGR